MNILGISCFYHDSAACLVQDGEIISAVQEERFTRKKHDFNFPINSINWCLGEAGIKVSDVDFVVFYDKPFIKFERILETALTYAPSGIRQFIQAMPLWLKQKLWIPELIRRELGYQGKILFTEHHESHAASAFFPSPFREAAFLTMDGVGEWDTASFGIGKDNDLDILYTLSFPHSLGLLYTAFTYYAGFRVNSAEYKVMGLAPYGEPKYADLILKELIDLKEDGSFKLNMKYFNYCAGLTMTNKNFDRLFNRPPRKPETQITQMDMDLAMSIQAVTEEVMLKAVKYIHKLTGQKNLCLAGGVALNCVANGRILKEGPFENIWIQPSSGDAGGALGAALRIWYKYLGNKRTVDNINDSQKGSFLGPEYNDSYIENYLKSSNIPNEKVIGWFQGRMEFGPRALGARSIIGDARSPSMQSRMNLKIKFRESFRPFAPSVLAEKAKDYFDINSESPYMLLVANVNKSHLKNGNEKEPEGFDRLKIQRSDIPAVTHVDNSARLQTVSKDTPNRIYYELINELYKKTGCQG